MISFRFQENSTLNSNIPDNNGIRNFLFHNKNYLKGVILPLLLLLLFLC